MATSEPWAIGDTRTNIEPHLSTVAVLNAGIETLTVTKNVVEISTVRVVFESVVAILTFVRVRVPDPPPSSYPLINGVIRTR